MKHAGSFSVVDALASSSSRLTAEVIQACSVDKDLVLGDVIANLGKDTEELEAEDDQTEAEQGERLEREKTVEVERSVEPGMKCPKTPSWRRGLLEGSLDPPFHFVLSLLLFVSRPL